MSCLVGSAHRQDGLTQGLQCRLDLVHPSSLRVTAEGTPQGRLIHDQVRLHMVRTDSHQLRPVAADSAQAEAVTVVTRAPKTLI